MDLAQEFQLFKRQCQSMAELARDRESKAAWLSMAERWGRLAKNCQSETAPKTPRPTSHRRTDPLQRKRAA